MCALRVVCECVRARVRACSALGLEWEELEELTGQELAELTQSPLALGQSIQRCCSRQQ